MGRTYLFAALFAALLGTACVAESADHEGGSPRALVEGGLRVAGPWDPPSGTRAIAATQYVPVVDPPAVSPLGRCTSSNAFDCSCTHPACTSALPGTRDLDTYLRRRFPYLSSGGLYCCRQNSATTSVPVLSVHAIGRAIDLMVPMEAGDADNGLGDPVANWLVENAEFIGIQRVIWDRAYWNGGRGFGLLSSASLPHTNHIHVELSLDGAARRTPFFTSGASTGTCSARCEGTRLVNADCSTVECAACLSGPPRCGEPPPPEPSQAARNDAATLPAVTPVGAPSRLTFVGPRRLFDTRNDAASAGLRRGDGSTSGPLAASGDNVFAAWSGIGLPANATGAWLNLAIIGADTPGFQTVYPAGTTRPETSSVNLSPGLVRANGVPAVFGSGGGVVIATNTPVHAIADLTAAFAPTGGGLTTTGPRRVLDTRSSDSPLEPGTPRAVDVGAPAGATGVVATVSIIGDDLSGFVTAYPCGGPVPDVSTVNHPAGGVAANTVISAIGTDGTLCLASLREVHAIVDVSGFIGPDGALEYQPITPRRLLDTRSATSLWVGRLGASQVVRLPIHDLPGMPADVWAVTANLVSTSQDRPGFLTAYPCGGAVPNTSSLNFPPTLDAVAAVTVMPVSAEGELCVFASGRTHLIVDLLGVWVHADDEAPDPDPTEPDPGDEGDDLPPESGEGDPGAEDGADAGPGPGDAGDAGSAADADRGRDALRDGPDPGDAQNSDAVSDAAVPAPDALADLALPEVGSEADGAASPGTANQDPRVLVDADGCGCSLATVGPVQRHRGDAAVLLLGVCALLLSRRRRAQVVTARSRT
jgi:hypothetical protein